MSEQPTESAPQPRRLYAVLLADMTGFSRLMGEHEGRAIAAIARMREVFHAVVPQRRGTLEVQVGDCFVALFDSAVDAVEAAVAIQSDLSAPSEGGPVQIRIGVHIGEVVRDGNEVFGDSINIAARLQTIATPGSIALSEDVYRAVRSRVTTNFRDLGLHQLKNIRGKIRIYEITPSSAVDRPGRIQQRGSRWALYAGGSLATLALLGLAAYQLRRHPSASPVPLAVATAAPITAKPPSAQQPTVVGVMTMAARGDVPDWMREVTRDGINTVLSKVDRLRVYSRQKIDFVREKQGLSELEAAEKLGIAKMISGALAHERGKITLELQVVDIGSGMLDASEQVSGDPGHLIELQNELAANVLRALKVDLSAEELRIIFANRTNDTLDAYRMLADTLGGRDSPPAQAPPVQAPPNISRIEPPTGWLYGPAVAWAEPVPGDDETIRSVVVEWAAALQAKDLDRVAAVTLDMSDDQRQALGRYFANADQLSISVAEIEVLVAGDEALATFTRKDSFLDKRSDRMMQLEVRLSSELARSGGRWKMRSVKKG